MKLSIKVLGLSTSLIMAAILAFKTSVSLRHDYSTFRASRDAEVVARLLEGVSRAVTSLTAERSVTQVTLTLAEPIPPRFRAMLDEHRAKSGAALDAVEALAKASPEIANSARFAGEIAPLRQALAAIRRDADQALSTPLAQRSADAPRLPSRVIEVIDRLFAAGDIVRDRRLMEQAGIAAMGMAQVRAAMIREYGGRGRTLFAIAALHGSPIGAATIGDMRENHGRVMQSWSLLSGSRDQMPEKVVAAIDGVRRDYFEGYNQLRASMYAAAETGRYPVDFETFFQRSGVALASAERLVTALGEAMVETARASQAKSGRDLLVEVAIAVVIGLATLALVWLLLFRIARRAEALAAIMRRLADGDTAIDTRRLAANDEIGDMVAAVEVFRANAERIAGLKAEEAEREAAARREKALAMGALADGFERSVGAIVGAVADAARTLETAAGELTAAAAETDRRSGDVAGAAGSAANNVETVAAASEELAASIREIGAQVEQSSGIAGRAVREAESAGREVRALSTAAERIGSIVSLIDSIAAKTNLLALNATIEAARAGTAGRGFAVVANEVKGLAEQTAKATAEIGSQIAAIQGSTQITVDAIEAIGRTIGEIDAISAAVAAAVTEQGAATGEIARNVQEAHGGAQIVTGAIAGVQASAAGSASAAKDVLAAARGLSGQAADMRREIDGFLATVRAA